MSNQPTPPRDAAAEDPIPCYVSGKGMHATEATWTFKTLVIATLEETGLGYDTRYRYYLPRFPDMTPAAVARMICDPIEFYDEDWAPYRARHGDRDELHAVTGFMLERDGLFRAAARCAIYCYDEAGFGSGVNSMRFVHAGKPILGFYNQRLRTRTLNLSNVLQLACDFPALVTLVPYRDAEEIRPVLVDWLGAQRREPDP